MTQPVFLHRWGDYSSLSIDPVDDCTFWYTNECLKSNGNFNWSSKRLHDEVIVRQ